MRLSEHLPVGAILVTAAATTRANLFPALVDALCAAHGLADRDGILAAVFDREAKMSTAVGQGIAIPHARVESVPGLCAALAVCPSGLDFPAPDGIPVRLTVLLVSSPSAAGLHVKALASVGRLGPARVAQLLSSRDAADLLDRLRAGEETAGK
jgi:mannitol/fructose-specific phosphotransferase system IIA component (Ntr-type)